MTPVELRVMWWVKHGFLRTAGKVQLNVGNAHSSGMQLDAHTRFVRLNYLNVGKNILSIVTLPKQN